jgi:hypothetical protein
MLPAFNTPQNRRQDNRETPATQTQQLFGRPAALVDVVDLWVGHRPADQRSERVVDGVSGLHDLRRSRLVCWVADVKLP